jgi:hypothetical protein
LRNDGETECADALEATFPLFARPDNSSTPRAVVKAQAAKGRDMIQLRSIVRGIERSTNTADEMKAELAKHGLRIEVGKLSKPAWVVVDDAGMVGKLAGMAHCTLESIIQRLGEPHHVYDTNPEPGADQRREDALHDGDVAQLGVLAGAGHSGDPRKSPAV